MKLKHFFIFLFLFALPFVSNAQTNRSYIIDSFDVDIGIKQDTTISVVEKISYDFDGQYNQGWRSIPKKDYDALTDIYVVDAQTGMRLEYSPVTLEIKDPTSWGKYAVTYADGATNIEWYFNKANTKYAWEIHYVVHGAIGFYKDYDELYWNLFTQYEVPINFVSATIRFVDILDPKTDQFIAYRTIPGETGEFKMIDDGYFLSDSNVRPNEAITFALGFPKGLVSERAYWESFAKMNWGIALAIALVLSMLMMCFIFWYKNEHSQKHNRSIVPQYEPPQKLKPAQMDIIYGEKLSKHTWTATIIDLAVRGYVKIEEDIKKPMPVGLRIFYTILGAVVCLFLAFMFAAIFQYGNTEHVVPLMGILFFILISSSVIYKIRKAKDYTIHLINTNYRSDTTLDTYEKDFIGALMGYGGKFSTADMQKSPVQSRLLFTQMQTIETKILEEIEQDYPGTYSNPLTYKKLRNAILVGIFLLCFILIGPLSSQAALLGNQIAFLIYGILISTILYLYFIKYNPRLSHLGNETWRNIEGFKHYLKVAERYRMQNLTPAIFEKFLPYAMIFGVEKQWSKNFDSIATQPPNWYSGGGVSSGLITSSSMGSGFSASAFSTSFSSSFASAFSSSGGGGASGGGGGGSAGGGGGGGGGGAR